ncbi:hypothetical protein L1987_66992 [Smallanthus sonchifolius]|uniref:Uncharacterized protein n=1 Tax=Smallanthus sonchifolius TaxID=185202 RepID=A0ACB9BYV4_9ASTR|nr:hypothetical protein L1987_66992 [Smallanthus sonchifolius]
MRNLLFSVSDSDGGNQSDHRKIPFSDVVVTGTRSQIWERKWRPIDIQVASWVFSVHLLSLFAPFTFTWDAFWVAFMGYLLTGLVGITLSYHRLLAHHSLKLPKWLEYTCVYLGVLAAQRDPIFWVSMHRYHHQFVDSEKDTHSPINGFWFSHMGWLFDSGYILEKYQERKNVEDLKKQWFYMFIRKTYMWHILGCGAILYAWGGFPYLVWGLGVRTVWVYHLTFLVNSACHIWGYQAWNTGDLSKNNWWVAMLTFGEGWHNNHHAFEFSARHGLEWWQIDISWYIIRFLEALGLATNVKVPTEAHKYKKTFKAYDINTFK